MPRHAHGMAKSREASPALTVDELLPDIDLNTFDWSLLNMPVSQVNLGECEPEDEVISRCRKRLHEIERNIHDITEVVPQGLKYLVARTRRLLGEDWTILKLYTNDNAEYPNDEALWSYAEWRRCDLVDFFRRICGVYFREVLTAVEDEVTELDTSELDETFLSLIDDILALAANEKGFVGIKEWERPGTKATLEIQELSRTEIDTDTRKALDSETGEPVCDKYSDNGSESESDTFDGEKMEEALDALRAHWIPPSPPPNRGWTVELPSRDR